MILTEEEAKTKRCQETFSATFPRVVTVDMDYPVVKCIGSACMAWRLFEGPYRGEDYTDLDRVGYCGKAGVP